jgi:hypothetical protein
MAIYKKKIAFQKAGSGKHRAITSKLLLRKFTLK